MSVTCLDLPIHFMYSKVLINMLCRYYRTFLRVACPTRVANTRTRHVFKKSTNTSKNVSRASTVARVVVPAPETVEEEGYVRSGTYKTYMMQ